MISLPDNAKFGPAMSRLNERQQRFVLALLNQTGRPNYAQAARDAGYSDVADGAKVRGHGLAHDPRVIEAIREEARNRIEASAFLAANVLIEIAGNTEESSKERRAAAGMLLDRAGLSPVAQQHINVQHTHVDETASAKIARIKELAAMLGVDPAKLLGANFTEPKTIDVTPSDG